MASSSGNSSGSIKNLENSGLVGNSSGSIKNLENSGLVGNSSGSIKNLENSGLVEQRKRKRMISNRESARRSRMRKQKHLDDLMAQVSQIKKENNQIQTSTTITTQHYLNIEAENSVLRAQMDELSQRLQSLDDILNYMNMMNTNNNNIGELLYEEANQETFINNNNSWNMMYLNQQPIMASADFFEY